MNRLQEKYNNEIVPAMIEKFGYKNIMQSSLVIGRCVAVMPWILVATKCWVTMQVSNLP